MEHEGVIRTAGERRRRRGPEDRWFVPEMKVHAAELGAVLAAGRRFVVRGEAWMDEERGLLAGLLRAAGYLGSDEELAQSIDAAISRVRWQYEACGMDE